MKIWPKIILVFFVAAEILPVVFSSLNRSVYAQISIEMEDASSTKKKEKEPDPVKECNENNFFHPRFFDSCSARSHNYCESFYESPYPELIIPPPNRLVGFSSI